MLRHRSIGGTCEAASGLPWFESTDLISPPRLLFVFVRLVIDFHSGQCVALILLTRPARHASPLYLDRDSSRASRSPLISENNSQSQTSLRLRSVTVNRHVFSALWAIYDRYARAPFLAKSGSLDDYPHVASESCRDRRGWRQSSGRAIDHWRVVSGTRLRRCPILDPPLPSPLPGV